MDALSKSALLSLVTHYPCSRPITDKAMKALEHSWHVDCFVCKVRSISNYMREIENLLVILKLISQECGFSFEGKKNFYSVDGDPVCGACLGTAE